MTGSPRQQDEGAPSSPRHSPAPGAAAADPPPARARTPPPAPAACGFVVICPPKAISFDKSDHEFHRDLHAAELKRELEWDVGSEAGAGSKSTYAVLPGGGARVLNASATTSLFVLEGNNSKADQSNEDHQQQQVLLPEQEAAHGLFAVFKGILTNRAALAASVGLPSGGDESGGNSNNNETSNAALIVRMYQKHGIHLLGRLEGSWSFCLFDAHQGRVLAARAPCGGVPLFEGRTAGGALAITCGAFLPPGCRDVHAIAPGCAKWGWSSAPRPYSPGVAQQREGRRPAGDRTILRRSIELGTHAHHQQAQANGANGSSGGGASAGAGGNGSGGGGHANAADHHHQGGGRRWSDASGVSIGPDEVAAAAAPAIPRQPLHADAPAYFPPRRSSETGGAGANGASWRAAPGGGGSGGGGAGGSQRGSSRRSSYENPPSGRASYEWGGSGGGAGSARPSGDRRRSGGGGGGSARPSAESRPPLAGGASARRASADGQGQAAAGAAAPAAAGAAAGAGAATAAMAALHV